VADEQKAALKKTARVSGGKDECQVRLKEREHDYWMGTEIGMLGSYGFQGQVTAGDGSDKQGKMGTGYNNLRRKTKKQQCQMGRESIHQATARRPDLQRRMNTHIQAERNKSEGRRRIMGGDLNAATSRTGYSISTKSHFSESR